MPENVNINKKSLKNISKAYLGLTHLIKGGSIKNDILNKKIDNTLEKLSLDRINNNQLNYAENIKSVLTQKVTSDDFDNNSNSNLLTSPEVVNRYNRYCNSDELLDNISYCARALSVLVDGIISPDSITKTSLTILNNGTESSKNKEIISNLNSINKILKIESDLNKIVYQTLKYGDCFIEICNYKNDEIPITQSLFLNENKKTTTRKPKPKNIDIVITETIKHPKIGGGFYEEKNEINKKLKFEVVMLGDKNDDNLSFIEEAKKKNKNINKLDVNQLNDVKLINHDPRCIVKLQSKRFKMNLGYLVIPLNNRNNNNYNFGLGNLQNIQGTGTSAPGAMSSFSAGSNNYEMITGVDSIYKELIKSIKQYVDTSDLDVDKEELKKLIHKAVKDIDDDSIYALKVRYVPPDRIEHFTVNDIKHFPYGESIFEKILYEAKLLIALKTAITIRRISDSSDKRIMYVDVGLPRQARTMIETLKESLKRRKFSIDSFNNINSIPTMISSYEDYYIPQSKGKRYVEFESLPPAVNIRDITDELKTFREDLVAGLEVPAAYINLTETISNKSLLTHESAMFAQTILSYQKGFSKHLFSLFSKIYKLIYNERLSDEILISLPPPRMLQIEKEAEHADIVARTIATYKELGINEEYLKKKYMNIDWEDEKEADIETNLDKRSRPTTPDELDDAGGIGGGFVGGSMGGSPPGGFGAF